MSYVLNDAFDELLDILADLFWRKGQGVNIGRPDFSVVDVPAALGIGSNAGQFVNTLTEAERFRLELKIAARRRNASLMVKPMLPTLQTTGKFVMESRGPTGLLGKLVAAHWTYTHARLWYMTRCQQLHFSDDTPMWLTRGTSNQYKSRSWYLDKMKTDRGDWPIGVAASLAARRFPSRTNVNTKYMRRLSLERAFGHWSAPFGGYYSVWEQIGTEFVASGNNKPKRVPRGVRNEGSAGSDHIDWFDAVLGDRYKVESDSFDGSLYVNQMKIHHGYKVRLKYGSDSFADIEEKEISLIGNSGYPWRVWGMVSQADRKSATYRMKIPNSFRKAFSDGRVATDEKDIDKAFHGALRRYYDYGYNLVNAVLSTLIERGVIDVASEFPSFARHCNWWWILPPTKDFAYGDTDGVEFVRYPKFADIGHADLGLADYTNQQLVDYVMSITPPPGTVAPWDDKGPLWLWPQETGKLTPCRAPLWASEYDKSFMRSTVSGWNFWDNIVVYASGALNNAAYDYVMGAAGSAASEFASTIASEWLTSVSSEILGKLESQLGKAFSEVMAAASQVATWAGVVSNVKDQFVGQLRSVANEYDAFAALDSYTAAIANDVASVARLDDLAGRLDTAMGPLRRSWGYADDLFGDMAALQDRWIETAKKEVPSGFYR